MELFLPSDHEYGAWGTRFPEGQASHISVQPHNGLGSSLSFKRAQQGTPEPKQKLSPEANFELGMVRYIYDYITLDSEAGRLP